MKRRSFFKSFMGLVATVALAPEIAFGVKLKMPVAPKVVEWVVTMLWKNLDYMQATLKFPCSDDDMTKWLNHSADVETFSTPKPDSVVYHVVNEWPCSKPYSELQRLRREAGLCQ